MTGYSEKIYGLVVAGGKSSRMGMDKAFLKYYEKAQVFHVYDLLLNVCDKVFISCNMEQAAHIPGYYEHITDDPCYGNIGPMAGLLTAFDRYKDASFLVIGCDYPFIDTDTLQQLFKVLLEEKRSVALYNKGGNISEPLLAGYYNAIMNQLIKNFHSGQYSLRQLLNEEQPVHIIPERSRIYRSIDTVAMYEEAIREIHQNR